MRDVQVEQVEGVVDGLDLAHLDKPHLDILSGRRQNALSMIVCLADDGAQVFEALHHADGHLATVTGQIRARVQRGAESFANFFHAKF